ncbi:MAG: glycosyltransferase family 2 protein [Prevotella sp.]|nr:glycosyltransferase family 2 protein [Prevotella sp.]
MISIIMPVYNSENYLKEMIDSIILQSYSDWELLLIEDGSTDHSLEICNEYVQKDRRISLIQQLNGGPGVARNTGIARAKGEYVYFADSDDWMESNMLESLLNVIKAYDADMVVTNYWEEYPNKSKLIQCLEKGVHVYNNMESIRLVFSNRVFSCLWSMLFKRSVLVEEFPPTSLYEDYITLQKWVSHVRKLATVGTAYYHYRQHPASLIHTRDKLASKESFMEAFLKRWEYIKLNHILEKDPVFFEKEYTTFFVKDARDTVRTWYSYDEVKSLLEKYRTFLYQQDVKGLGLSMKMLLRRYFLLHFPRIFVGMMKFTACFSKGFKKNQSRDNIIV